MEYDPIGIWSWKTFFKAAATVVITAAAVAVAAVTGGNCGCCYSWSKNCLFNN